MKKAGSFCSGTYSDNGRTEKVTNSSAPADGSYNQTGQVNKNA